MLKRAGPQNLRSIGAGLPEPFGGKRAVPLEMAGFFGLK